MDNNTRTGRQEPTTSLVLPYQKTDGRMAVDLYELAERTMMPWQKAILYDILARNENGLWVHTKFGYAVPRRNGKGEILIARELYGLAVGERIMHTAHLTSTSHSAWERLCGILDRIGQKYYSIKAKGQELIEIPGGGRIEFRTRTAKGGLGEGYDVLIIDEAQEYKTDQETALKYVVSAASNPQTIMCGTPPTAVSSGTVFKDFRQRVLAGKGENGGWSEWSVEELSDITDRDLWYETNPSLGYILEERAITDELTDLAEGRIDFNIQRLGLWLEYDQKSAISRAAWEEVRTDILPELNGRLAVGIKYSKDGETVSLAVAAHTKDEKIFIEIAGHGKVREGNSWIIAFLKSLGRDNISKVVIDGANGQAILEEEMRSNRLGTPYKPKVAEIIEANQRFENGIYQNELLHMEQPALTAVVSNCEHRAIGSSGGFGFKSINALRDISLMEAVSIAAWAAGHFEKEKIQNFSY
ncbi:MAG: terminase [Mogibacterium sp.]|nr:terminase [Mogibacterium sp.]